MIFADAKTITQFPHLYITCSEIVFQIFEQHPNYLKFYPLANIVVVFYHKPFQKMAEFLCQVLLEVLELTERRMGKWCLYVLYVLYVKIKYRAHTAC